MLLTCSHCHFEGRAQCGPRSALSPDVCQVRGENGWIPRTAKNIHGESYLEAAQAGASEVSFSAGCRIGDLRWREWRACDCGSGQRSVLMRLLAPAPCSSLRVLIQYCGLAPFWNLAFHMCSTDTKHN